jgi:hypothetical protein
MKNSLIRKPIHNFILGLISVFQILYFISPREIRADDRCGPGYVCWEKAGGSSSLYSWCELSSTGQYCQGGGVYDATCTCEGSSNCTCDLGPGTTCENPIETGPVYECLIADVQCSLDAPREEQCPPTQTDPYLVYGDSCVFSGEYGNVCSSPTGSSHIGCCYGDTSSPDPTTNPTNNPNLTADVKANGSDTNIIVSEPYTISWQATGATSCTLNGVLSNFGGNAVYDNGPGTYAYTYRCTNGSNTVTDVVAVEVDCSTINADIKANGSDIDITVSDNYTISWTATNADDCTLNGNGVTLSGNRLETAGLNGDYAYIFNCENYCGDTDTDEVTVTVDLCGNGICAGFENCLSCEADCGACPDQWFQLWGGSLFAGLSTGNAVASTVSDAATYPYLMARDAAGHALSDGFPITGGGHISANGRISARSENPFVIGSAPTRLHETYSYFARQYSLGLDPTEDFSGSANNAQKPTLDDDKAYYYHQGDLTIQEAWAVSTDETYVIFIEGNLHLADPGDLGQLITVQEGGFLAFIVSGDINVDQTVGNTNPADSTPNIAGLYVADGTITVEGAAYPPDKRFIGEGSFIGWTNVVLERDLADDNALYPAETFIYRPDFVTHTPKEMKRSQRIWQETN